MFFNLTMSYHRLNDIVVTHGYLLPLGTPHHCPLQPSNKLNTSSNTFMRYSEHLQRYDTIMRTEGRHVDERLQAERRRLHDYLVQTYPNTPSMEGKNTKVNSTEPSTKSGEKQKFNEKNGRHLHEGYNDARNANQSLRQDQSDKDDRSLYKWFTKEEVRWAVRPRLAAWMASHCPTESRREAVVAALQRHINITTVGRCGNLTCGRNHMDTYCFRWLAASHLFYLSFENALCDDYHTEKLWRPMEHGMVPVVYGGSKYRHILPFGSFIDVLEFSSAAALAQHLVYLATHPAAYLRYLQWRRYWRVRWPVPWCNLCAQLHQDHHHPSHTTLDTWWNTTTDCYDPLLW